MNSFLQVHYMRCTTGGSGLHRNVIQDLLLRWLVKNILRENWTRSLMEISDNGGIPNY